MSAVLRLRTGFVLCLILVSLEQEWLLTTDEGLL